MDKLLIEGVEDIETRHEEKFLEWLEQSVCIYLKHVVEYLITILIYSNY